MRPANAIATAVQVRELPLASERPADEREAFAALLDIARRKTGSVPAEFLVRHLLALDAQADWPVQRAAMEAVLRRVGFAQRDKLRLARRPRGALFGVYTTRAAGRDARPYETSLESAAPLLASCDCPDFRRNSLGLCKHVWVVLDHWARRPKTWQRALATERKPCDVARLMWNSLRPLKGADDWMQRVRLVPAANGSTPAIARWFERGDGESRPLRAIFGERPVKRLTLARELAAFARDREPALAARLREEIESLERVVELERAATRLQRAARGVSRRLYPYQTAGVARFLATGRLLLADDMGLGKTTQAITACHALFHAGLVQRGLLVVPASLKPQWLREWSETSRAPIAIVDGDQSERAALYRSTERGFLIANYEQALKDLGLMRAWKPELVVLDEAQRIKNWAAKTSNAIKELRPRYRLVLTGTPMENRLEELASIVEWVDDHALEPKWRLVPWHTQAADGRAGIVGARNLDTLRARLAPCMLRRTRAEVLTSLPHRSDNRVPIALTAAQRQAHDDLDQPIAKILGRASKRGLTQQEFLRLMTLLNTQRVICNGLAQLDFESVWPTLRERVPTPRLFERLDSPKLIELREIVTSLVVEQARKVVVFSQWRRMLELAHWSVSDVLATNDLRAVFFTGREGQKRRTQNIVDFHDDPSARILFATDAGGVGLNLQRAANACINLELPWNPAVLEQRIGRIHRLGQKHRIETFALVAEGCIEERIAALVADKRALFRGLFDGDGDEVRFERSGRFLETIRDVTAARPPVEDALQSEDDADATLDDAETVLASGVDALVEAADETAEAPAEPRPARTPAADAIALGETLAGLKVERAPDGTLRVEAPPESADALIALFEGLARALKAARG